jgi:hypothetical protein
VHYDDRIELRISGPLKQRFRLAAQARSMSVTDACRMAIEAFIASVLADSNGSAEAAKPDAPVGQSQPPLACSHRPILSSDQASKIAGAVQMDVLIARGPSTPLRNFNPPSRS